MPSYLEVQFAQLWNDRYPAIDLHSEWRFAHPRRYRLDFAHLPTKIGVELNGGVWMASGQSPAVPDLGKMLRSIAVWHRMAGECLC